MVSDGKFIIFTMGRTCNVGMGRSFDMDNMIYLAK